MPTQLDLELEPIEVRADELARKKTLGAAIDMCAELAELTDKQLVDKCGWDKAQWSRWQSGQEGVVWPKFEKLMDVCRNDAPLLWMLQQRGYDLSSLRRCETQLERENRLLREQIAQMNAEREIERRTARELISGRAA